MPMVLKRESRSPAQKEGWGQQAISAPGPDTECERWQRNWRCKLRVPRAVKAICAADEEKRLAEETHQVKEE